MRAMSDKVGRRGPAELAIMPPSDGKPTSTLGERLLEGVRNLWSEVQRLAKVADHHGLEIEDLKKRATAMEREVRSAQISRGMHKAKNARLKAALDESQKRLTDIRSVLKMPDDDESRVH